jgi:type IV pilus assembly protein PilY1
MNISSITHRTALAALAAFSLAAPALAEDIDIYAGGNSTGDLANVLLILDSSANWSTNIPGAANCFYKNNGVLINPAVGPVEQGTKLGIEQCALYNVIDGLPVKPAPATADNNALFNVAIMLMNESPNNGTYPRQAFIPMSTNNKAALKAKIAAFAKNADKANNADYGLAMYEAYLYYKNLNRLNGGFGPNGKRDDNAFTGVRYNSPSGNSCGRNYVILIGNGSPQPSNPEKNVKNLLAALPANSQPNTPDITQIGVPLAGNDEANWSDEMSRYMRYVDVSGKLDVQGIISFAIAVKKGASDGGFPYLMNSIANQGGGSYYEATNADQLTAALNDAFNQMQAVNSVFASASLPVSVNLQGTYQNQVFMGMFRPDADAKPRWVGNMKQYKFGLDNLNKLFLADSAGNSAISSTTGFINPSAVSYWSTPFTTGAVAFWTNQTAGTPPSATDSPDGEVVEKGGAAQRLRIANFASQASRKVLTCVGCAASTALTDANGIPTAGASFVDANAAITQAKLVGTASAAERTALINWVRGTDNAGDEHGPGGAATVRPSIHGDVLHSRPAVVDYGGATGVVVFYGGNDGMLHAIKGNQSALDGGDELWSFVPEEMFGKLNRLRANTPDVRLSTTPAAAAAAPRDYFVDGPITVYRKVVGGVTNPVMIYVGMRRGGRQIYAFDVTNPTKPIFKWKKTNTDLPLLGQTWSAPKVARLKGYAANPVVIFGGGYDATAEDASNPGATTMGKAIYVLDAMDGTPLKTLTTLASVDPAQNIASSVAADVTLVDSDYDGKVDRAYAVDMGGQVYRVDFEDGAGHNAPGDWTVYKVADLSGGTNTGRKFFFAPDVVLTNSFAALNFGSGDREKPLLSATQDHFFQIFDRKMTKGPPVNTIANPYTPIVWGGLVPVADIVNAVPTDGCYISLAQGEKVVNAAASIGGSSYFGTNRPAAQAGNVCAPNLGVAKAYAMPLFCMTPTSTVIVGGGLPPGPVVGIVSVDKPGEGSILKPFIIGAPNAKQSGLEVSEPPPPGNLPRKRRYWYQEVNR